MLNIAQQLTGSSIHCSWLSEMLFCMFGIRDFVNQSKLRFLVFLLFDFFRLAWTVRGSPMYEPDVASLDFSFALQPGRGAVSVVKNKVATVIAQLRQIRVCYTAVVHSTYNRYTRSLNNLLHFLLSIWGLEHSYVKFHLIEPSIV
jgi:hypothetical protein